MVSCGRAVGCRAGIGRDEKLPAGWLMTLPKKPQRYWAVLRRRWKIFWEMAETLNSSTGIIWSLCERLVTRPTSSASAPKGFSPK